MYCKYRYLVPNIDIRIVRWNIVMHRYNDVSLYAYCLILKLNLQLRKMFLSPVWGFCSLYRLGLRIIFLSLRLSLSSKQFIFKMLYWPLQMCWRWSNFIYIVFLLLYLYGNTENVFYCIFWISQMYFL